MDGSNSQAVSDGLAGSVAVVKNDQFDVTDLEEDLRKGGIGFGMLAKLKGLSARAAKRATSRARTKQNNAYSTERPGGAAAADAAEVDGAV